MIMVDVVSRRLVNRMRELDLIESDDEDYYVYRITMSIASLLILGCTITLSVIIHTTITAILFLIGYASLRKSAGGMHLDTYSQCFSASVTVFSAVILIISKMSLNIWLFALTIISGLIIAYIGTVNHPNLGLVENEIIILKKRTRFMLAIEFIILLVLALLRVLETVAVCIEFSIIMCALLMLLAKLLRQEVN